MTLVGVVSDTHGQFDPWLEELFDGVAHILHGGDIGPESIVEELERLAPVTAVCGNTDHGLSEVRFPVWSRARVEGVGFLLTHIVGDPLRPGEELRRHLTESKARVVVFGHTHVPRAVESDSVLWLNPGSAGPRRFRLPRSACLLDLDGLRPSFYDLERREPFDPGTP